MKLSCSNTRKFLIFSQKKAFLIIRETKPPKNCLYLRKRNLYIFEETSYISGIIFPSSKNEKKGTVKKCFEKWNLRRNWMLEQPLLLTGYSSIQFFN